MGGAPLACRPPTTEGATVAIAELETPTTTAIFMARRRDLVLVRVPQRTHFDPVSQEKYVTEGQRIEFREGRFETADPELIEWLRGHDRFGDSSEGFVEIEPPTPAPTVELQQLMAAAARLDVEAIETILAAERAGHERELVIEAAEAALEQIKAIEAAQSPPAT